MTPAHLVLPAVLVGTTLAACGGADRAAVAPATATLVAAKATAAPAPAAKKNRPRGAAVGVRSTAYGRILVDGQGLALYAFTADGTGPSKCYGQCAVEWPPLLTKGKPRAVKGARASLLGTVRRRGGKRQVTYDGQPLYYWYGDARPGDVGCHDVFEFGGTWLVLRANGAAVD